MPIYSFLLTMVLALWTLRYLAPLLRDTAGHQHLRARFGSSARALAPIVAGKRVIWVQAVSVGEVLASTRLIAELESALGAGWIVVISTTTNTGQALAKEKFGSERVFYMPLDFAFAVRACLRVLKPAAIVLIESEIWPRMMHETRKAGIPVIVVNARVSDRSFHRSMKVRWLWSRVLRQSTLWLAQSEEDARRLVAMGARADGVQSIGNLKYDIRAPQQTALTDIVRSATARRPIIVAGSTHLEDRMQEEDIVFAAMTQVWEQHPDVLLILAPRHPPRFDSVAKLAGERGSVIRASELFQRDATESITERILLLDTIGDLASIYSLATIAFVGGSLLPVGGHNPLEPAQFGVPIVMGSSFQNFRAVVAAMQAANAICIVDNVIELHKIFLRLLAEPETARTIGKNAKHVFESETGATARAVEAIVKLVRP